MVSIELICIMGDDHRRHSTEQTNQIFFLWPFYTNLILSVMCLVIMHGYKVFFKMTLYFLTIDTNAVSFLFLGEADGKKMTKLHGCQREGLYWIIVILRLI